MNFDQAFVQLHGHEGGYSFHPRDPGGETMWGVTARVARKEGYLGEMRDLPLAQAKEIYRKRYWDAVRADEMPEAIRYPLFDAAVNSGPPQAIEWLQEAVNVEQDGILGPMTMNALGKVNPLFIAILLVCARGEFMTNLPTWPAFGKGWTRRLLANFKGLVT